MPPGTQLPLAEDLAGALAEDLAWSPEGTRRQLTAAEVTWHVLLEHGWLLDGDQLRLLNDKVLARQLLGRIPAGTGHELYLQIVVARFLSTATPDVPSGHEAIVPGQHGLAWEWLDEIRAGRLWPGQEAAESLAQMGIAVPALARPQDQPVPVPGPWGGSGQAGQASGPQPSYGGYGLGGGRPPGQHPAEDTPGIQDTDPEDYPGSAAAVLQPAALPSTSPQSQPAPSPGPEPQPPGTSQAGPGAPVSPLPVTGPPVTGELSGDQFRSMAEYLVRGLPAASSLSFCLVRLHRDPGQGHAGRGGFAGRGLAAGPGPGGQAAGQLPGRRAGQAAGRRAGPATRRWPPYLRAARHREGDQRAAAQRGAARKRRRDAASSGTSGGGSQQRRHQKRRRQRAKGQSPGPGRRRPGPGTGAARGVDVGPAGGDRRAGAAGRAAGAAVDGGAGRAAGRGAGLAAGRPGGYGGGGQAACLGH